MRPNQFKIKPNGGGAPLYSPVGWGRRSIRLAHIHVNWRRRRLSEKYPSVTAEGFGEYCNNEDGTVVAGRPKLKAGEEQTFTFAAAEGPFDLQDPTQKTMWAPGYREGQWRTRFEGKGKGLKDLEWERGLRTLRRSPQIN